MDLVAVSKLSDSERALTVILYALELAREQGLVEHGKTRLSEQGIKTAKLLLSDGWRPDDAHLVRLINGLKEADELGSDSTDSYIGIIKIVLNP